MQGLLRKELYMAAKYCRSYILIAAVFAVASFWSDNMLILIYPVLMAGIVPVSLLSYDEKCRWDTYAGVFPYSRQAIVSAKYITALLLLGGFTLLMGLIQVFRMVQNGQTDIAGAGTLLAVTAAAGMVGPSLILPAVFKFGAEKGRIVYYAAIIVSCGILGFAGAAEKKPLPPQISWFILLSIVLFACSWLLSVHVYQKREF